MKEIRFHNFTIEHIAKFFSKKISIKKSLLRSEFIKQIKEDAQLFEEKRMAIIHSCSELDSNGVPIVLQETPLKRMYKIIDKEGFEEAWKELLNDFFIIQISDECYDVLIELINVFQNDETVEMDVIECEMFEDISAQLYAANDILAE